MDIPQTYSEATERTLALGATLQGGRAAAQVIYDDVVSAVVAATRCRTSHGWVSWNVNEAELALREGWNVFWGVWIQTSDIEQSMAQLDGYLSQDPDARALGGAFYLYGWRLARDRQMLASLGKRPRDPSA
ncbi:hypothetical protein [Caulobacter sp. Root343]|uniref:hypothetical protein n=1 Tax=Caulobacter sp. Root343 TaxID=1736520 RepID=UPI0006FB5B52|nr:hypothetical protein [Caulobacter sp. Root343]KQV66662.1 hypothetical protein ASC70_12575 [Caulobacter sp. Root343]